MALSSSIPADDHGQEQYTRHAQLWLDDGNIILVASGTTGFRVHRSVLAMKSNVFKDMFSFPQPDAVGLASDCPVLHLQDSPDDLAYFIDAVYNGMRYRFGDKLRPTWEAVRALLLMGNKYDVEELYNEGVRCLHVQLPHNIEDWDAIYDESWFILGKHDVVAIEIANVCRFLHLPELRIVALYLCCTLPGKVLKNGATLSQDGEDAVRLHAEDLAVCLKARKVLRQLVEDTLVNLVFEIPSEGGALCSDMDMCDKVFRDLQESPDWPKVGSKLYSVLASFWWELDSIQDICNGCLEYVQLQHLDERQKIRNNLHKYIVVPPL